MCCVAGAVSTFAGSRHLTGGGEDGTRQTCVLQPVRSIVADPSDADRYFIAEETRIRTVYHHQNIVGTVAGAVAGTNETGTRDHPSDALAARFTSINHLVITSDGRKVFLSDQDRIRCFEPHNNCVSTLLSRSALQGLTIDRSRRKWSSAGGGGSSGGDVKSAAPPVPVPVLYISAGFMVHRVDLSVRSRPSVHPIHATDLFQPQAIECTSAGLIVAFGLNGQLSVLDPDTGSVEVICGGENSVRGYDDGRALIEARLCRVPAMIVCDEDKSIYLCDLNRVRRVTVPPHLFALRSKEDAAAEAETAAAAAAQIPH